MDDFTAKLNAFDLSTCQSLQAHKMVIAEQDNLITLLTGILRHHAVLPEDIKQRISIAAKEAAYAQEDLPWLESHIAELEKRLKAVEAVQE